MLHLNGRMRLQQQHALSVDLTGLTAGTLYNWRVRANCTGGTGNYVQANFTTATPPPACGDPTGLSNTTPTQTSTTVSWNTVGGANNYDVDYKTNAASTMDQCCYSNNCFVS